jgi:tetratricopeptide (TPR) repeat protein
MLKSWFSIFLVGLAVLSGCSGGGGGGGSPDVEPPRIISGPSTSEVGVRGATVEWTTDKDANSIVIYGETSAYTDSSKTAALVASHAVGISGLTPVNLYHYMVASEDADGRRVESGDRTFTTLAPTSELVGEGWDFFEQAGFDSALTRFEAAYAYEPEDVGVLEGLGWTLLRLYRFETGGQGLSARSVLEDALAREPGRTDCLAGAAFVYYAIEMYDQAIDAAGEVLAAEDGYIFDHDHDVTAVDVRYCLILSLVATGDFIGALDQAKIIDPSIDLDPEDASTWDGYLSFEEAVIVMVEGLRDLV